MALESSLTLFTQIVGVGAMIGLPTTTSIHDNQGEIYLSKSGAFTTLTATTTSLIINPLAASAEDNSEYASIQEVNKAELYLESLSDEELANLCETTDLLIQEKEEKDINKTL